MNKQQPPPHVRGGSQYVFELVSTSLPKMRILEAS